MDQALINQKLESLRRCIRRLETRCPASAEDLAGDLDAQDIVSLNLTRAVQLSVDIALHWIAEHPDIKAPATMGESFEVMAGAPHCHSNGAVRCASPAPYGKRPFRRAP
ncbi:DUF86 domain-containing protein [Marinobacterium aestuariivivens]|uniref:DUF86 domain-containing protein n=1 Tax=Marinobacterium aestuariivivens TaxID=1698799 RepID=A0ABW1ZVF2_9GAMM